MRDFATIMLCPMSVLFVWVQDISKLWTDLDETWWTGWVCDKDELIRFWRRSRFGSDNFLSDSSPLRERVETIYITISQKVVDGFV